MFMFYKIGNNYYVLVGNKYMQVEFKIDKEEINAVPTGKSIERDKAIGVKAYQFNEDFKKQLTHKEEPEIDEHKQRSRFGRDR